MARIRKAIVAGVGAGLGAAVALVAKGEWKLDSTTLGQAVGAFLTTGVLVGWATYKARNAR